MLHAIFRLIGPSWGKKGKNIGVDFCLNLVLIDQDWVVVVVVVVGVCVPSIGYYIALDCRISFGEHSPIGAL